MCPIAWVVNAYLLTFGGFLLLGGRLGDLFGHRRLFVIGLSLFTTASLACGLAQSQGFLVGARAVQGLGGAIVAVVALSLIMTLFTEPAERAKAMGVIGFVAAGGGSVGVLLGGILTDVLNWHWIFLVNIPVGAIVLTLCLRLVPGGRGAAADGRLDVAGAVTVTAALMLAVYAIVNGNDRGWASAQTLGMLAVAIALLAAFIAIEARSRSPLMPLGLFRLRNVATANVVGVLWAAAMFAWFFLSALYLQLVLGYSPLEVGLAFLPANLVMAAFSMGLSAKLVMRYGFNGRSRAGWGWPRSACCCSPARRSAGTSSPTSRLHRRARSDGAAALGVERSRLAGLRMNCGRANATRWLSGQEPSDDLRDGPLGGRRVVAAPPVLPARLADARGSSAIGQQRRGGSRQPLGVRRDLDVDAAGQAETRDGLRGGDDGNAVGKRLEDLDPSRPPAAAQRSDHEAGRVVMDRQRRSVRDELDVRGGAQLANGPPRPAPDDAHGNAGDEGAQAGHDRVGHPRDRVDVGLVVEAADEQHEQAAAGDRSRWRGRHGVGQHDDARTHAFQLRALGAGGDGHDVVEVRPPAFLAAKGGAQRAVIGAAGSAGRPAREQVGAGQVVDVQDPGGGRDAVRRPCQQR